MPTIHFLNVKEGDCSVIQHSSSRVSVIDVCNAKPSYSVESKSEMAFARSATGGVGGNFNQKAHSVNPVAYLKEHAIGSMFRFILTHPDMDHMDGIKALFDEFPPTAFWDTNNKKKMDSSSWSASPYNQADWELYKNLRDTSPESNPKRITNLSGAIGQYWNRNEDGSSGGGMDTRSSPLLKNWWMRQTRKTTTTIVLTSFFIGRGTNG